MPTPQPGPYSVLTAPDGRTVPWYIVPFDKKGRCKAPGTVSHLLQALESGEYTHTYLFSHGWNNDWQAASARYSEFVEGYRELRVRSGLAMPDRYRPLLIGVIWPSTSLVLPWEKSPQFAAGGLVAAEVRDAWAADENLALADLVDELPEEFVPRIYELAEKPSLNPDEAEELAGILAPLVSAGDEVDATEGAAAAQLLEVWSAGAGRLAPLAADESDDSFGTAAPVVGGPQTAGILSSLDPRHALRMATVWRMKDRAGTVGAHGVGPLLREALGACDASFHITGHSYGGKVVLSAVSYEILPRPVTSVLLLQPAVSHLCFAADVDGSGRPGGFRVAMDRVQQPIITTFSRRDFPLTNVFHLAVRRKSDLGEQRIAAGAPSRYAALGGFGPGGLGGQARTVPIQDPGTQYDDLDGGIKVLALEGSRTISSHGDVANDSTFWALYEQVRRS